MKSVDKATRNSKQTKINQSEAAFLDAAEIIFAKNGYSGSSMRAVAEMAKANLGAIHYYFGSKEMLVKKVLERKLPSAEERLEKIKACIPKSNKKVPDFKLLAKALIEPFWVIHKTDPAFDKMVIRILNDPAPQVAKLFEEYFHEPNLMFVELIRKCNPKLSSNDFFWRLNCILSSLYNLLSGRSWLMSLTGEVSEFSTAEEDQGFELTIQMLHDLLMAPTKMAKV